MGTVNLRFDCYGACLAGEYRHAQTVMKELGITYQRATPQSMGDQWWFWNCEYTCDLPHFIEVADLDPMKCIGFGLNEEMARTIAEGAKP